jgi:hypothetical protein
VDILEVLNAPKPVMELIRHSVQVEIRGVLRAEFEGILTTTGGTS